MSVDPRDQDGLEKEVLAQLQASITATMLYIVSRASPAELFGLQGYLSQLASQMSSPVAARHGPLAPWDEALWQEKLAPRQEMPDVLRQQLAEMERQQALMRVQQQEHNQTMAQYRQEG